MYAQPVTVRPYNIISDLNEKEKNRKKYSNIFYVSGCTTAIILLPHQRFSFILFNDYIVSVTNKQKALAKLTMYYK